MWITIAVVWSAFLAGFLLGAWWSASRSISEMKEYYDVLSREFKALLDTSGREVAAGGERSGRDASSQSRFVTEACRHSDESSARLSRTY